jgi:DNA (cytosine-5)-methyltransferase 1
MKVQALDIRNWRENIGLSQAKLAEITGISQHLLSAHELGKAHLTDEMIAKVVHVTKNSELALGAVSKKKRYQEHSYKKVCHDETRVKRNTLSSGNKDYLKHLAALSSSKRSVGLSALSLFSGCGGLCLGFKAAGFKLKAHLEIDKKIRKIYSDNFCGSLELGGDIQCVTDSDIEKIHKKIGPIDIIIGGPPCQGFSLSGKRKSDDPRNMLFLDYLRFVDVFRPKLALMENVRLLTSMKNQNGGFVRDDIVREFSSRGYHTASFEINAKDYGVPQHRERVIFIALDKRLGISPSLPQSDFSGLKGMAQPRSFADACSDLKFLESGECDSNDPLHEAVGHPQHVIDWLWDVPEGYSAHDNADPAKRPPSGYNTTYKRQVWLEPASTVQTTFGMISGCRNVHPIATRSLTIREAARIQSFPDDFIFSGSLGSIRTAIGNAVPPLLAFRLAEHIAAMLADLVEIP